MNATTSTRIFIGNPSDWKDVKIHLTSLQGLWGGWHILIDGNREVIIQHVSPAMREERFKLNLGEAEFQSLLEACIQNDVLSIQPSRRMGHPDETMLQITLINAQGESRTASKWAGDSHPNFDPVYKQIFTLTNRIQDMQPFHSGPFDWSASLNNSS
jgi:hypothetical protein